MNKFTTEMKDYEQLYYDSLYEIKLLKQENKNLKEELVLIKTLIKSKSKKEIINSICNYFRLKRGD